jgi:hypothetical protein
VSSTTSIDKLNVVLPIVAEAYSDFAELPKVTIENFAGFVRVPVGLAVFLGRVSSISALYNNIDLSKVFFL